MGWKDNAKRAGAAAAIVGTVASVPDSNAAVAAAARDQAKAAMQDRANERAARLRIETTAKGNRNSGSGRNK